MSLAYLGKSFPVVLRHTEIGRTFLLGQWTESGILYVFSRAGRSFYDAFNQRKTRFFLLCAMRMALLIHLHPFFFTNEWRVNGSAQKGGSTVCLISLAIKHSGVCPIISTKFGKCPILSTHTKRLLILAKASREPSRT